MTSAADGSTDLDVDDLKSDFSTSKNKIKRGWLKLFRGGAWEEAYFVLNSGTLSYYESEHHVLPYGTELKVTDSIA
jgi:hypothetical protein